MPDHILFSGRAIQDDLMAPKNLKTFLYTARLGEVAKIVSWNRHPFDPVERRLVITIDIGLNQEIRNGP